MTTTHSATGAQIDPDSLPLYFNREYYRVEDVRAVLARAGQQAGEIEGACSAAIDELNATIAYLRAQLASAQKDAERYRWLRDIGDPTWTAMAKRVPQGAKGIDAAIDAARAQITNNTGN